MLLGLESRFPVKPVSAPTQERRLPGKIPETVNGKNIAKIVKKNAWEIKMGWKFEFRPESWIVFPTVNTSYILMHDCYWDKEEDEFTLTPPLIWASTVQLF